MKKAAFLSSQMIAGFDVGWYSNSPDSIVESPNAILAIPFSTPGDRYNFDAWREFARNVDEFELIVAYVHHDKSEPTLELLKNIPSKKLIFIMCPCHEDYKRKLISNIGKQDATVIVCKTCNHTGVVEMTDIARKFLYEDMPVKQMMAN